MVAAPVRGIDIAIISATPDDRRMAPARMTNGAASAPPAVEGDYPDPAFDPFRRTDRYGLMGWARQHWTEYVRLVLLSLTLLPFKALGALSAPPIPGV